MKDQSSKRQIYFALQGIEHVLSYSLNILQKLVRQIQAMRLLQWAYDLKRHTENEELEFCDLTKK